MPLAPIAMGESASGLGRNESPCGDIKISTQHGGTRKDMLHVVAVAMERWPDRSGRPTVD